MRTVSWGWVALLSCLALGACSSEKPKPQGPQDLKFMSTAPKGGGDTDVDEPDEPEPEPKPEPAPQPEPTEEKVEAPKPKPTSGRPPIMMGPTKKIDSTFGLTPGSVLKIKGAKGGAVTFRLAEYALPGPATIKIEQFNRTIKFKGRVIGGVIKLEMFKPEKPVQSAFEAADGKKYEIVFPMLKTKGQPNLAVGTVDVSNGGESGPVSWKIYPSTSIDDGFDEAHFQITSLGPIQYFYLTTAQATEE